MKTSPNRILVAVLAIFLLTGCSKEVASQKIQDNAFAKGADISWLPQMEATGYQFYSDKGDQEDCFKILKDHGINSIRLRTFVNPSDDKASGHCSKDETVAMAVRAQKWGMRVMIDFHYSDSWADPGK
jgi:arabinogalactan endo-1,4-beta-galactosidase